MGRGRKQQKGLRMDDPDEDTASTSSTSASSDLVVNPKMEEEHDEEALLEGFIEALYEKRASIREAALKSLINAFTGSILDDYVEQEWETLSSLLIGSIKRGSSSETALAARALGLLVVTVGSGDAAQNLLAEASPHLAKVAKLGSDASIRISAVESLAILGFVSGVEDDSIEKVMAILWQIATHAGDQHADQTSGMIKPSSELRAAAITSWAVLLSASPFNSSFSNHVFDNLSSLSTLLDTGSLEIQRAAGEAIALIYEMYNSNKHMEDSFQHSVSDNATDVNKIMQAREDQLLEQMKALSIEAGGKGHSRKEISLQRSSFRGLVASIEDGVCPETHIRLRHGDILKIDTWIKTLQLNAFRKLLAQGFHIHMQENSLLHDIFGFSPRQEKQKSLTAKEKRLFFSPNSVTSKRRTQVRNHSRSIAQAGNVGHYRLNESEID
ncbi:hypothetical protein O6H91_09G004000 [Diphasiastrum complanatum]|uniref:Uncharacterized protein n=1 Tax=Diphasiastrum complanatum TaxID=34168 RepID=A0ACC2CKV6_DIPCM|nr:hypothetical protein O6H91_09G004000 [Diphasiastrum complanatum]